MIAILIVLNAQDRKDREQSPPPTVTDTVTETTPYEETPAAMPDLMIMLRAAQPEPPPSEQIQR